MEIQYTLNESQCQNLDYSTRREWVLTNGIGGFAMGTASGLATRRYHGLLVASLNPPTERHLLFAGLEATAQTGSNKLPLNANQYPGAIYPDGHQYLKAFEYEQDQVAWTYKGATMHLRKTLRITPGKNEVTVSFENKGGKAVQLFLRPLVCFRDFHSNFAERSNYPQAIELGADRTTIEESGIRLEILHSGATRFPVHGWYYRFEHQREVERGLDPRDDFYCPNELRVELPAGETFELTARVEGSEHPQTLVSLPNGERHQLSAWLRQAASRFIVETDSRTSILAGYPWFSDWGRDTMIALPGICLHTGRVPQARQILRDYASQMFQGLIPNRFVERGERADYNTVDATLWFGNAIYKTLRYEWNEAFASEMLQALSAVIAWHQKGTLYGIKMDPHDGLLAQGEPGTQLTWMDAKIGDWVVTPRHGKPVEINGLWINLLRVAEWLSQELGDYNSDYTKLADLAESHFEAKFWHEVRGHYLDTAEPNDASLRPNQVIAISLPFSPCTSDKAKRALQVVEKHLLTPFGLRTLSPEEPGYRGRFKGPMSDLDAAYHQGTVWPWLLGPYISAFVKHGGTRPEAKHRLRMVREMMNEFGLGGIAECYDGDEPHTPGGCPWQAWSVAEVLRTWIEDVDGE
jgi:predicted glycogen debranching enzyme